MDQILSLGKIFWGVSNCFQVSDTRICYSWWVQVQYFVKHEKWKYIYGRYFFYHNICCKQIWFFDHLLWILAWRVVEILSVVDCCLLAAGAGPHQPCAGAHAGDGAAGEERAADLGRPLPQCSLDGSTCPPSSSRWATELLSGLFFSPGVSWTVSVTRVSEYSGQNWGFLYPYLVLFNIQILLPQFGLCCGLTAVGS